VKVEVRLFATLTRYLPPESSGKSAVLDVVEGTTLAELIRQLGIPPEMAHLTLLNGIHQLDKDVLLREGDVVAIFPPIAGGVRMADGARPPRPSAPHLTLAGRPSGDR